jgi:hypothetical protein
MLGKRNNLFAIAVAAVSLAGLGVWYALHSTLVTLPPATIPANDGAPTPADQLDSRFASEVRPFIERYCFKCHSSESPKAELDLSRDATVAAETAQGINRRLSQRHHPHLRSRL